MKGQAETCNYTTKCTATGCGTIISYANEEINDQIYKSLADTEIQYDIMSQRNQNLSLEDVINLIASKKPSKESHTALNKSESLLEIFPFKKDKSTNHKNHRTQETDEKLKPAESCVWCGQVGRGRRARKA